MTALWMAWTVASAAEVDFECSPGDSGGVVGLPPLEVTCTVVPPSVGTYEAVTWTFGDGSVVEGATASATYEEPGRYAVTVRLEGFVDPGNPTAPDPQQVRHDFVTVCGEPVPSFELENLGGLDYELVNTSEIAPGCLEETTWTVFAAGGQGEPLFSSSAWQPRLTFPDEGTYVVRLDERGLAGARSVQESVQVEFRVSDQLRDLDPYGCAVAPPVVAFGSLAWVMLAALIRRRP